MAVDKLVDSTQLDADLTAVANAIRTKGGTSAALAFPAGFVDAIDAIETGGGGWTTDGIADGTEPSGAISISGTSIYGYAFYNRDGITDVHGPNVTTVGNYAFGYANGLEVVRLDAWQGTTNTNNYIFGFAGNIDKTIIVLPSLVNFGSRMFNRGYFKAVDIGPNSSGTMDADTFYHNTAQQIVGALILRRTAVIVKASSTGAINGLRDVYVPSSLISEYEAATNWSTQVAAGKITFHAIEGSQYENYYADGTPIT